jgi:hypothetical protein
MRALRRRMRFTDACSRATCARATGAIARRARSRDKCGPAMPAFQARTLIYVSCDLEPAATPIDISSHKLLVALSEIHDPFDDADYVHHC